MLFAVPQSSWVDVEETATVRELCDQGLLLGADEPFAELRRRDERLEADQWRPAAALYHFSTRLRDADLALPGDQRKIASDAERAAARFVERHGPPPGHFHSPDGAAPTIELPLVRTEGGLYDALARRRTTRGFDPEQPLTFEQLSVVLYEVFGCRGYASIHGDVVVTLRKGSPSGGGLHPVEAYPLVRNVEGVEPGLYHYSVRTHALELIAPLNAREASETIASFTTGQSYFASAAAAFVLTARFARSFWKYRRHPAAYASLLMDAAHLSQTLYLVTAELALGAFFTNLINAKNVEDRLRLDGYEEGALAVCGCGVASAEPSPLDPDFSPYVPRETAL